MRIIRSTMRSLWLAYVATVFLSFSFLLLILWIAVPLFQTQQQRLHSPLPPFLTLQANAQVTTLDLWLPMDTVGENQTISQPQLSAKSAIAYDLTTNKLLYTKNAEEKLPMASITKIMTAIVSLEHKRSDDRYVVSDKALVGEDSMGLGAGEILTIKELLYGLILHSGNDAAEVLAENYAGGRESFIAAMNEKAAALGLINTHFTNPTGLEGDGNQYTTAHDLVVITRYALTNFPDFKEVAATLTFTIAPSLTHKAYYLENETNLLTTYPGVKGLKTGYTPEAGLCLVTYLEYSGHKIIAVVLGSEDRRDDMKEVLDYSLRAVGVTPPHHS